MEKALIPIWTLIKNGWDLYKNNIKSFIIPLLLLIQLLFVVFIFDVLLGDITSINLRVLSIIIIIFSFGIYLWGVIILIQMIDNIYNKKKFDLKAVSQINVKKIFSYVWISILVVIITFVGFILFIVPGLFFMVWYSFAALAMIIEEKDLKGLKALRFSKKLIKGRAWDTLGRTFVPSLFVNVILYISFAILLGIAYFTKSSEIVSTIISTFWAILSIIVFPLNICFLVILYNNLKETRK